MSRRQYNQAQRATSAAPNLRAAWRAVDCLAPAGNAFGATDDVPALVQQDGRQFRVKLTYRF